MSVTSVDRAASEMTGHFISLGKIADARGAITFIENDQVLLPFLYKRVYFLYHMSAKTQRGGHAHKKLRQAIIAIAGSFDLILDNGDTQVSYRLDSPTEAFYLPEGIWREMQNFSDDCVILVFASEKHSEEDYIRNYQDFLKFAKIL